MERVAKGDMSYCALMECSIRKQCGRALENYSGGPTIVSSFLGNFVMTGNQANCDTFIEMEK